MLTPLKSPAMMVSGIALLLLPNSARYTPVTMTSGYPLGSRGGRNLTLIASMLMSWSLAFSFRLMATFEQLVAYSLRTRIATPPPRLPLLVVLKTENLSQNWASMMLMLLSCSHVSVITDMSDFEYVRCCWSSSDLLLIDLVLVVVMIGSRSVLAGVKISASARSDVG